ncbi:hypothetical protein CRYUN_Cryun32bG0061500 [Craigia yunnanensis]
MRAFKKLINKEKPSLIFIQETKFSRVTDRSILQLWGKNDVKFVQSDASGVAGGGGLISMWSEGDSQISSVVIKERYIWLKGKFPSSFPVVNLINLYTPNDVKHIKEFLEELAGLKANDNEFWCYVGNFNEVLYEEERVGSSNSSTSTVDFVNFVYSIELVDLPLVGRKFTWHAKRGTPAMSRLDRFLLSTNWLLIYSSINQWCLKNCFISDHIAICLGIDVHD